MLATVALIVLSAAAGVALLWLFARTSDPAAIERTKKRLQARLLELRLWADEPRVVLRAQKELFKENGRYFGLMLRPAIYASLPLGAFLIVLQGFYGWEPLRPGEACVVTVQLRAKQLLEDSLRLEAPPGIIVETPGIRALELAQVSWRLRAEKPVAGELVVRGKGWAERKQIVAGTRFGWVSPKRVRSRWQWLLYPGEAPIRNPELDWISVQYPAGSVRLLGLEFHWLVWFFLISLVTALLLKNRFGVVI